MKETVWHMKEQKEFCTERIAWKKALYSKYSPKKQNQKVGRFSQDCQ